MVAMKLQQVTEQDFESEVLVSDIPVLVEFGATWCGPCKVVEPELQALAQEYAGRAKVVGVDIDQSPYLARQLGIQSVPTFLVFHQGRPVTGKAGALKKAQLAELLEKHQGNMSRACSELDISRARGYRLLGGMSIEELLAKRAGTRS